MLGGHEPTPAAVDLEYRPPRTRLVRAGVALLVSVALLPLVLLPPHVVWALLALAAGPFLAYREWTGEYLVRSFAGKCPRCGNALAIKPGSRIRLPYALDCFQCHHHPRLEVDGAGGAG